MKKFKLGDKVILTAAPWDKLERIGKEYEITMMMENGCIVQIDDNTFMTVRFKHIKPA